jgi:hypothetical protein
MSLNVNREQIICAAIWYPKVEPRATNRPVNTPGGVVLCGHRHGHIISQVMALTGKKQFEMGESIQGFLTNKNRFLNREEAAKLHIENGGKLNYSSKDLFSEDLY